MTAFCSSEAGVWLRPRIPMNLYIGLILGILNSCLKPSNNFKVSKGKNQQNQIIEIKTKYILNIGKLAMNSGNPVI